MAHLDPTMSLDTIPELAAAAIDGDPVTYIVVIHNGVMYKVKAQALTTAIDAFLAADNPAPTHSHA